MLTESVKRPQRIAVFAAKRFCGSTRFCKAHSLFIARTTHMRIVTTAGQRLFRFAANSADGDAGMAKELGGKGAALQEMSRLGIPVPPGFTVPTDVCRTLTRDSELPPWFEDEIADAVGWLEHQHGQVFG